MIEDKKLYMFRAMSIPKAVAKLSVPMIISSLVMVIYNMADTYFVGLLNDPIQNAAVTLAAPVLLAFNAVNNLFGVGCSSMMSRALGREDYDTVKKSSAFGFYSAILFGILFSLICTVFKEPLLRILGASSETAGKTAEYLFWTVTLGAIPSILNVVIAQMVRAEGASLHASLGTMSGCLINTILDPVFILPWGLNMGAAGAGMATMLANVCACIYFMILLYCKRKKTLVCVNPRQYVFKKAIVFGVCAVGIPASIQNLLNVVGSTFLNNMVAKYGADAVAAMGITQKINAVPWYVFLGISQGVMPLVGYNYASGNIERMKKAIFFSMKISLVFLAIVTFGYYIWAGNLIALFMSNDVIISYGTRFLRGFCLGLPFVCLDFLSVGVFQATGMGRYALLFAIIRKVILEIPAIFLMDRWFPLYGLAYTQFLAEFGVAVVAIGVLMNLMKKIECNKNKR